MKDRQELMPSVAVFQAEEGKRSLPKGAHVRFDVETRGIQSKCNFAQDISRDHFFLYSSLPFFLEL